MPLAGKARLDIAIVAESGAARSGGGKAQDGSRRGCNV